MRTAPTTPDAVAIAARTNWTRRNVAGVASCNSTSGSPVTATAADTPAQMMKTCCNPNDSAMACTGDQAAAAALPTRATAAPAMSGMADVTPIRRSCAARNETGTRTPLRFEITVIL